jgi:hypothetical protein
MAGKKNIYSKNNDATTHDSSGSKKAIIESFDLYGNPSSLHIPDGMQLEKIM